MTEDTWGVNYRALNDLFQISNARLDMIKYEVGVQMIEIYNEQVRDLLVSDGSNRRYPFKQQSHRVKFGHMTKTSSLLSNISTTIFVFLTV